MTTRNVAIGKYEVHSIGKKIGSTHYVHVDFISQAHSRVISAYERALWNLEYARNTLPIGTYVPQDNEWNVVRFDITNANRFGKISLLLYDMFYTVPHPVVLQSIVVDLDGDDADVWVKYDFRIGRPKQILHRKERLVPNSHEQYDTWARLTMQEEIAGLFAKQHVRKIGYKSYWERLLKDNGLWIIDNKLVKVGDAK